MDLVFLALILSAVVALYFYMTKNFDYWEKRGVPSAKNPLPGIGNLLPVLTQRVNYAGLCEQLYKDYDKHSMLGFYDLRSPALIIREPELAKTVMQTKFNNFEKNMMQLDPKLDPLLSKNPFFNTGEEWVAARKRLTYAFSTMRLKIISEPIQLVCERFNDYVDRHLKNQEIYEVELKDLFSRFTCEVVAIAAMGIEGKCFDDDRILPDSLLKMGHDLLKPTFWRGIVQTLVFIIPKLGKFLSVRFLPKHVDTYFRSVAKDLLEMRKKDNAPRNDFFQLMIDMETKNGVKVNEEIMAAHVISFFIDGFETSSITIMYVCYYLAANPDVQQKLREEVRSVLAKHEGAITYDSVRDMTYMNQVISEAQRLEPVTSSLLKVCTEKITLEGSDGLKCEVTPGTNVIVPIAGMHRDEKYFPNPDKYDPERFSEERKDEIPKFSFLPFGEGPRACIGMRMALLLTKSAVATFVNKYSFEVSPKTRYPFAIDPAYFLRLPMGGVWVKVKHAEK